MVAHLIGNEGRQEWLYLLRLDFVLVLVSVEHCTVIVAVVGVQMGARSRLLRILT